MSADRRFRFASPTALLAMAGLVFASALPAATVTVANLDDPGEGFNDPTPVAAAPGNPATTLGGQRLAVFEAAAEHWGALLASDVEIAVAAEMNPLDCDANSALLGQAGPESVFRNFPGGRAGTWYVSALADAIGGSDLDPTGFDIGAEFNSNLDDDPNCLDGDGWFYGIGVDVPANRIGFFSTVLHEIAHGLGMLSLVDPDNGQEFQGFDDIYSVFLEDHSTGETWPGMTNLERFLSGSDEGDLHWVGENAVAAGAQLIAGTHPGGHVQMYAPDPVEPGSSVSHWDTELSPNELMEPFDTGDFIDDVTVGAFVDMGWQLLDDGGGGGGEACEPSATTLCIDDATGDGRFAVTTFVESSVGGFEKFATAIPLAEVGITKGGIFFFNNAANPELLIKVLNACSVNGHYWVFWSAGTNLGLTITVIDTQTGDDAVYVNPDRTPADVVQDIQAFPCT